MASMAGLRLAGQREGGGGGAEAVGARTQILGGAWDGHELPRGSKE